MSLDPYYRTPLGEAYLGDANIVLKDIPSQSVNLIVTSPPYALKRKKQYGNVEDTEYIEWFMTFVPEFQRVLTDDGSLVINIGGTWKRGEPVRSVYHFQLLLELCKTFNLAQDFYLYDPARLPTPAEWVTVRRIRVKDAVECIWWLSKSAFPKASNKKVLRPYSESMLELFEKGYKPKLRPSGHDISSKFGNNRGGSIPSNLLQFANTESNSRYFVACRQANLAPNPARFPLGLPKFFIEFLTNPDDVVLDPFAGSNATGEAAEILGRRWIAIEIEEEYLKGSMFRFDTILETQWTEYDLLRASISVLGKPRRKAVVVSRAMTYERSLSAQGVQAHLLDRSQTYTPADHPARK